MTWLVPTWCAANRADVVPQVPPGMHGARCWLVAPVWLSTAGFDVAENVQFEAPRVTSKVPGAMVMVLPLSASPALTVTAVADVGGDVGNAGLTVVVDRTVVAVVTVVTGVETVVDGVWASVDAVVVEGEATRCPLLAQAAPPRRTVTRKIVGRGPGTPER